MVITDIILYDEVMLEVRSLFQYDWVSLGEDSHEETEGEY